MNSSIVYNLQIILSLVDGDYALCMYFGYYVDAKEVQLSHKIEYELLPTPAGVCITCTFLNDSMLTDCVAVVHQRISQLSPRGLMNIESSHKFTRSGATAYGCIEEVNQEQYQIGVIGGRMKQLSTSSTDSKLTMYLS